MNIRPILFKRLIDHVNRKRWWHVPPGDPRAYAKRGKFLASSFREAEFWGRPLDQPERVIVSNPLVGDEGAIEKTLFGKRISDDEITIDERWALDSRIRKAALKKRYDSIVLMSPKGFARFKATGIPPRSMELNIFRLEYQLSIGARSRPVFRGTRDSRKSG